MTSHRSGDVGIEARIVRVDEPALDDRVVEALRGRAAGGSAGDLGDGGAIDPKSQTSTRTVPLLAVLRDYLDEHLLATGRSGDDLALGRTPCDPFVPSTLSIPADKVWEAAGLDRITLHKCRHTFASLLIDSGENPKAVQEFMGHATITVTFDLYGHLFPGSRDEARVRMDAYLEAELAEARGPIVDQ